MMHSGFFVAQLGTRDTLMGGKSPNTQLGGLFHPGTKADGEGQPYLETFQLRSCCAARHYLVPEVGCLAANLMLLHQLGLCLQAGGL